MQALLFPPAMGLRYKSTAYGKKIVNGNNYLFTHVPKGFQELESDGF